MKLKKIVAIAVALNAYAACGQVKLSDPGTPDGGLPGSYLFKYAGDAAEFGKGGSNIALVDNTAAMYGNPAGLGNIRNMEALITYSRPFNDYNFFNGAFAYPFGRFGVVGINIMGYISPQAPRIDDFGLERGGSYGESNNAFLISYGRLFLDRFGVGATLKMATQSIDNYSGLGVGADIGVSAKLFDWLYSGVSIINLEGPTVTLITTPDHYSTILNAGIGSRLLDNKLSVNLNIQDPEIIKDKNAYSGDTVHTLHWSGGVEYWVFNYLGLRAGMSDKMFTLGTGVRLGPISFDYAALIHRGEEDFSSPLAHAFSLRYVFGKPFPQKELELNNKLKEAEKKQQLRQAEQLFIDGLFVKSDELLKSYLDTYPKEPEGLSLKAKLNEKLKTQKTASLLADAQAAFAKRDYDKVNVTLKDLSEVAPNNPTADSINQKMVLINKNKERIVLIKSYYAQNKIQEMAKELDIVLSIDSTNAEAREYRGKIDKQIRKLEAEQHYNLAAKYYYNDKDVEKANAEIQKALALVPDYKEANDLYQKISPEVKTMYLQKVGQMVDNNKLTVDNKDLRKLVQLDAQDRLVQAQNMYSNGQYDEALSEVEGILKGDSKNMKAQDLKKTIEKALSQRKAENSYNEALKFFNDNQLVAAEAKAQNAAELAGQEQKYQQLLSDIRKKMRESDIALAKEKLASGKDDDVKAAQTLVERYLEADPRNADAQKLLVSIKVGRLIIDANAKIDKGDFEQADQTLQKALKLDPDNGKVKNAFKNLKDARDVLGQ